MTKSTVNKAGNYTKPGMRKQQFQRIKAGSKGGKPGQWSARKAQLLAKAYKDAGGGYKAQPKPSYLPKKALYKVYITYYETGEYYIGVTSKSGVHFDNYFGSNTTDLKISHKEVLFHTHNKSDAKLMELIYQLRSFHDKKCLNKMLNIRLRRDFIKKIPRFTIKIKDGISSR